MEWVRAEWDRYLPLSIHPFISLYGLMPVTAVGARNPAITVHNYEELGLFDNGEAVSPGGVGSCDRIMGTGIAS